MLYPDPWRSFIVFYAHNKLWHSSQLSSEYWRMHRKPKVPENSVPPEAHGQWRQWWADVGKPSPLPWSRTNSMNYFKPPELPGPECSPETAPSLHFSLPYPFSYFTGCFWEHFFHKFLAHSSSPQGLLLENLTHHATRNPIQLCLTQGFSHAFIKRAFTEFHCVSVCPESTGPCMANH